MSSEVKTKTVRVLDNWRTAGIKTNEKQREFAWACEEPDAEEIIFSGAIRSGKSQACAKKQVRWAWEHPGTTHLAVRKTFPQLRDSTKMIYLTGDGKMPPAIPPELIPKGQGKGYRASDEEVHLYNGSKIIFRQAEEPRQAMRDIRNVTLASVFVDQIEEFDRDHDEELYETWLSRLSDPRGPNKLIAAANPGPTDHFIYVRAHPDSLKREPQTRFINVTLYDNIPPRFPESFLDPKYAKPLERRGKKDPTFFKRYCLGEWGAFGGKRFKTWDPARHLIPPFNIPSSWEIIGGVDVGWDHPTVHVLVALDPANRYYGIGEYWARETPPRLLAKGMRELEQSLGAAPSSRWMDPSAWAAVQGQPSLAEQLLEHGLDAGKADNDRIGGWARIDDLLQEDVEGDPFVAHDAEGLMVPRFRIMDGRMPKLVEELPNAQIKDGTEDIEKKNDDALDALRYVFNSRPPVPLEDEEEEDDPHAVYAERRLRRAFAEEETSYAY